MIWSILSVSSHDFALEFPKDLVAMRCISSLINPLSFPKLANM